MYDTDPLSINRASNVIHMIYFATLNQEGVVESAENLPKADEKQLLIAETLEKYKEGLKYQQEGDLNRAGDIYRAILTSDIVNDVVDIDPVERPLQSHLQTHIVYNVHLNLGNISNSNDAVNHYLSCLDIDSSDSLVYYKLGTRALEIGNVALGRKSLESGIQVSSQNKEGFSLSKLDVGGIMCLEKLIDLLLATFPNDDILPHLIRSSPQIQKHQYALDRLLKTYIAQGAHYSSLIDMGFPPDEVFRVMAGREMSNSSQTTQTADTVMEVGKKQYFDEIPIITLCPTTLEPNDIGCAFLQLLKDRTENNRLSIWSIPLQIEQPEYGDPNSSNSDAVPSATQPESCSPDPNQSMPEQEQEDVSLKRKRSISESNEVKPLAAELDADEEGQDEDEEPASKRFTRRSKITRSSNVGPTSNQDALSENYQSINRILMSFGLSLGTNHRANIEPDDLIMTQCDDIVSRLLEELKKSNALTASGTPVKRRGRKARVTLNPEGISQTVTLEDILEFVARQENVESGRSAVLDLATISTDSVLDGVHSYIDACFAPKEWTTHWPSGLRPTLVELLLYLISNDISLHTNVNVADESVEQLLHTQRLQKSLPVVEFLASLLMSVLPTAPDDFFGHSRSSPGICIKIYAVISQILSELEISASKLQTAHASVNSPANDGNPDLYGESLTLFIRYHYLSAKFFIWNENYDFGERECAACLSFMSLLSAKSEMALEIVLPNCFPAFSRTINQKVIEKELQSLNQTRILAHIDSWYEDGNYDKVVQTLEELFGRFTDGKEFTFGSTRRRLELSEILVKSYEMQNEWKLASITLARMLDMLALGLFDPNPGNGFDLTTLELLNAVTSCLHRFQTYLTHPYIKSLHITLPVEEFRIFNCNLTSLLALSLHLISRSDALALSGLLNTTNRFIQSFHILVYIHLYNSISHIPIVNLSATSDFNRSNMTSLNSTPISSTATSTQSSPTASPAVLEDAWCHPIQLLIIGHEVLGARKLCMEMDGVLVKRIVKELKPLLKSRLKPNPAYVVTSELVQCYHCLYRVDITLDCAVPHDHSTKRAPFTLDVASDMFALIAAFAEDKLSKNQALKTDLKERLDDIKNRLGEPPLGNAYLATITSLVRRYLDTRLSDLLDAVFPADSPTMASRNEINEIHFRIHYVQARNLLIPFKSKFKTPTSQNASKMKDEIELIIEKFEENIYYNPKSFEGWWQLGLSYAFNAYLILSFSGITSNKDIIADLQRRAYLCYYQSYRILLSKYDKILSRFETTELASFYSEFGQLIYSMFCSPMYGLAWKPQTLPISAISCTILSNSQSTRNEKSNNKPVDSMDIDQENVNPDINLDWNSVKLDRSTYQAAMSSLSIFDEEWDSDPGFLHARELSYDFGFLLFRKARALDKENWLYPFMMGKFAQKRGELPPKVVIALYYEAMKLVPDRSHCKPSVERLLNAHYKFIASICKYFLDSRITVKDVKDFLSLIDSVDEESAVVQDNENKNAEQIWDEVMKHIQRFRDQDKASWHHRLIYRTARLYLDVLNEPQKAKEEMKQLIRWQQGSKGYNYFYKTEFEKPGGHFLYSNLYTTFLIELAELTSDHELLRLLCKKLRKSDDAMIGHQNVWNAAVSAYLRILEKPITKTEIPIVDSLPLDIFEQHARIIKSQIVPSDADNTSELKDVDSLFRLQELKQINGGYSPDEAIDQVIVNCYCSIFYRLTSSELKNDLKQLQSGSTKILSNSLQQLFGELEKIEAMKSSKVTESMILDEVKLIWKSYKPPTTDDSKKRKGRTAQLKKGQENGSSETNEGVVNDGDAGNGKLGEKEEVGENENGNSLEQESGLDEGKDLEKNDENDEQKVVEGTGNIETSETNGDAELSVPIEVEIPAQSADLTKTKDDEKGDIV